MDDLKVGDKVLTISGAYPALSGHICKIIRVDSGNYTLDKFISTFYADELIKITTKAQEYLYG